MSGRLKISPEEAKVILRTNEKNVDASTKRLLQKVVDKRPMSEEEIGELEGIIVNAQLVGQHNHALNNIAAETDNKLAKLTRRELEISIENRRRIIAELRSQQPPLSVRKIAEKLDVTTATVMNDINAIRAQHERIMDSSKTLEMLGQTVNQYDILHGKAMALCDSFSSPMAKAAFLRTAISALDSKSKLMGETGIIHRVPERQEILVAHADAGTVRQRIEKLIRAQETRAAPVLELGSPKKEPELIDADLVTVDDGAQEDAPE